MYTLLAKKAFIFADAEIVVEIVFSLWLSAEGLAVTHLLDILQTAGDAAITVAVKGVERQGNASVHAGIDLAGIIDWLAV